MALKKQTAVRTGKIVRELMLGDKVVHASTIMVYSSNEMNKEIKIENLTPSSNQEIFSCEDIDWNKSVIYKIVDFVGNVEVGKVVLQDIKRNHVTLTIERIMWKKEPNKEKVTVDIDIHPKEDKTSPVKEEQAMTNDSASLPKAEPLTQPKKQKEPLKEKATEAVAIPADNQNSENYQRLLHLAMTICSHWDLGYDLTDIMNTLKEELKQQGVSSYFNEETLNAIETLRTLKEKGVKLESLLSIL